MNRVKSIILVIFILLVLTIVFLLKMPMPCLIKLGIGVSCPTCGMTRSLISIFNLDIKKAFYYNILGIPFFIFCVISFVWLIIDFFLNKDSYFKFLDRVLSNKYFIIFIFVIAVISTIINNIKGI